MMLSNGSSNDDTLEFVYSDNDLFVDIPTESNGRSSHFDALLRSTWDNAMQMGAFNYELEVKSKILPGKYNILAQLNVKRGTTRRKPESFYSIKQPFNKDQFHFGKVKQNEILFYVSRNDLHTKTQSEKLVNDNAMIINVSPLEYGHCLFVPRLSQNIPQTLTEDALRQSLEMALLSRHPGFILGFNSLCAFASVNHLHLHTYYIEYQLGIQTTPLRHVSGICWETIDWPVTAYVFLLRSAKDIASYASTIHQVIEYLQEADVAHNLAILRGTDSNNAQCLRIVLWPRKSILGAKITADCCNPAFPHLCAQLLLSSQEAYENITESQVIDILQDTTRLPDDLVGEIRKTVIDIMSAVTTQS